MPNNPHADRPILRHELENDLEATVEQVRADPNATDAFEVSLPNAPTVFVAGSLFGGNYRLEKQLGRGGMGEAWMAHDETADRHVVLKFVPKEIQNVKAAMDSVRASFRKAHALQHQHICPLYGLFTDPEHGLFVVMKFVDGISLDDYRRRSIAKRGRMPFTDSVNILWAAARALDYAHEKMIIHRDIKPQNIMIGRTDGVQLIDFGLAEEIRMSMVQYSEVAMDIAGTRPYMAPEQWRGRMQDARTDQYALAATAYELFSGTPPFQGSDLGILRECVLHDEPEPIAGIPDHVNAALLKALAKKRDDRFEDCRSFIRFMALKPKPEGFEDMEDQLTAEGSGITHIPEDVPSDNSQAPVWVPKSMFGSESHSVNSGSLSTAHRSMTNTRANTPYRAHEGGGAPIPVIVTDSNRLKKQDAATTIIRASREERTVLYGLIAILLTLLLVLAFYLFQTRTPQASPPTPPPPRSKPRAARPSEGLPAIPFECHRFRASIDTAFIIS